MAARDRSKKPMKDVVVFDTSVATFCIEMSRQTPRARCHSGPDYGCQRVSGSDANTDTAMASASVSGEYINWMSPAAIVIDVVLTLLRFTNGRITKSEARVARRGMIVQHGSHLRLATAPFVPAGLDREDSGTQS